MADDTTTNTAETGVAPDPIVGKQTGKNLRYLLGQVRMLLPCLVEALRLLTNPIMPIRGL